MSRNFVHFYTQDGLIVEAKECVHPAKYDNFADMSMCIYDPKKKDAIVWDTVLSYNSEGMPFRVTVQLVFVFLASEMVRKKIWSEETSRLVSVELKKSLDAIAQPALPV